MKIIANVPVLYQGIQYKPGEVISEFDAATLALWLKYGSAHKELESDTDAHSDIKQEVKSFNFQEQVEEDLDNVFFNGTAKEFVTTHKIGGGRGKQAVELDIVVDYELYRERNIKDAAENITHDGMVFFVKKNKWIEQFKTVPQSGEVLMFDNKQYKIESVEDDTGMLEITLSAKRGR